MVCMDFCKISRSSTIIYEFSIYLNTYKKRYSTISFITSLWNNSLISNQISSIWDCNNWLGTANFKIYRNTFYSWWICFSCFTVSINLFIYSIVEFRMRVFFDSFGMIHESCNEKSIYFRHCFCVFCSNFVTSNKVNWIMLTGLIRGWQICFTYFVLWYYRTNIIYISTQLNF